MKIATPALCIHPHRKDKSTAALHRAGGLCAAGRWGGEPWDMAVGKADSPGSTRGPWFTPCAGRPLESRRRPLPPGAAAAVADGAPCGPGGMQTADLGWPARARHPGSAGCPPLRPEHHPLVGVGVALLWAGWAGASCVPRSGGQSLWLQQAGLRQQSQEQLLCRRSSCCPSVSARHTASPAAHAHAPAPLYPPPLCTTHAGVRGPFTRRCRPCAAPATAPRLKTGTAARTCRLCFRWDTGQPCDGPS